MTNIEYGNTNIYSTQECKHNIIIPKNWLNSIYRNMKRTYHNHDIENYINYHDIYTIYNILHTTSKGACYYY